MKAHKYWSLGALAAMIGTFYTGYKNNDIEKAQSLNSLSFSLTLLFCSVLSVVTGTSYGSVGSAGVAMMAIGNAMGINSGIVDIQLQLRKGYFSPS